jgi:hypothetical protein
VYKNKSINEERTLLRLLERLACPFFACNTNMFIIISLINNILLAVCNKPQGAQARYLHTGLFAVNVCG